MPEKNKNNQPHYIGHRHRLKNRFLDGGLNALQPYEIVELFFTFVVPRQDVKKEAKEIINKYGSVRKFFDSDPDELRKNRYVKENAITLIKFIKEISLLYQKQQIEQIPISLSKDEIIQYCIKKLGFNENEEFWLISLDSSLSIIKEDQISKGLINKTPVYPRKILETALANNAHAIILLHNHTNGNPEPSEEDKTITKAIEIPAKILNLNVYDHIIVSKDKYFSFKENKLL